MKVALDTLRETFAFDAWGNDAVFTCTAGLTDAQLDRPIEMGEGSLRATLRHIYGAARNWYERWNAPDAASFPKATTLTALPDIADALHRLAAARTAWLAALTDADMQTTRTFTFSNGKTYTFPLGLMMLHVCNHGVHHRAQAVNMLRQLGAPVPKPGADYIFMRLARADQPPPKLDTGSLRTFFAYADWARGQVHAAAEGLTDAQLDRPFEMGLGTLRKTLHHIGAADQWWMENWHGRFAPFPELTGPTPLADIQRQCNQTAIQRNEFLARQTDADLLRIIEARPRPDIVRRFPIGVTMLQLCCHGTHHRAQAANMLRHLGAKPPELDLIEWVAGSAPGA